MRLQSRHQPAGFLQVGILLTSEIKFCQNREMKGMLGGVRRDGIGEAVVQGRLGMSGGEPAVSVRKWE